MLSFLQGVLSRYLPIFIPGESLENSRDICNIYIHNLQQYYNICKYESNRLLYLYIGRCHIKNIIILS